jgi:hypothetical protein
MLSGRRESQTHRSEFKVEPYKIEGLKLYNIHVDRKAQLEEAWRRVLNTISYSLCYSVNCNSDLGISSPDLGGEI